MTMNDEPSAKRSKVNQDPTRVVTWNCNGLVSRCNWNVEDVRKLVRETQHPDVICIQEVRLKAISSSNRSVPLPMDYKNGVQKVMDSIFAEYDKYWSLADKKYAGTLTLLHKRLHYDGNLIAFSTKSALSLLLKHYKLTKQDVELTQEATTANPNNNNNGNHTSTPKKTQQTSMKSFFAPKASPNKHLIPTTTSIHHDEGRFQFLMFSNMDLIQTYVPNNGNKEESYQRRREWDNNLKEFLLARKQILQKTSEPSRPLLWCGDCNVAKEYKDGSHWERLNDRKIYEWWRDESKCYASGQGNKLDPSRHDDDKGLASFTENERRRFREILQSADLSDIWRELHPNGSGTDPAGSWKTLWDRPDYTWRGHLSKDGNNFPSKYEGKGQRIDYFLLSPSELVKEKVQSCEILGYGAGREGLFCGSDHCAQILTLKSSL